jgi:uncharacterized protein YukE
MSIPEVNAAAVDLEKIADDLRQALDQLKATCERLHGCWGEDEFGEKFAKNYLPAADEILKQSAISAEDLDKVAANLKTVAKEFQKVDQEGGESLELTDSPA